MMSGMAALDLDVLDRAIEVDVVTTRRDGTESRLPIWVVVVDGDAYIRSYKGPDGAWYRRVRASGRAALDDVPVMLEPAHDPELNRRIDDAFEHKYGERSRRSTDAMVSPEVAATTLRVSAA
jgi:hypothetical protein